MVREFALPDVGEGISEGEIVKWLVEEGDTVTEDQPVVEVETDKALVEIPSPVDGTVADIRVEEGEIVPVGEVIVVFAVEGEAEPGTAPAEGNASRETTRREGDGQADPDGIPEPTRRERRVFAPPHVRRLARELAVDLDQLAGSGPGGRITEADVRAAAEAGEEPAGDEADTPAVEAAVEEPVRGRSAERAGRDRTLAAPATRRIADELGIDINDVPAAEERDGHPFVTAAAVREYAESAPTGVQAEPTGEAPAGAREEVVPYRGIRRTIGERMSQSKFTAPHVTHHDTATIQELVDTRAELKARAQDRGIALTYLPFVMKAVVGALKAHPQLNATLDEEREEIVIRRYYNIGVAVATEHGLMVPVVDDVDTKGLLQIASEVHELAEKARDRTISPDEMRGSTFSITNFGSIGGEYATPIINYPEVAILGLGSIAERPVVEEGEVVARPTLPLSLAIDHRVVDGADAAAFTNTIKEYLENPSLLLLE